jgi:hypothetical protein
MKPELHHHHQNFFQSSIFLEKENLLTWQRSSKNKIKRLHERRDLRKGRVKRGNSQAK